MQNTLATPQIFINGRIVDAVNFESDEIYIKVSRYRYNSGSL
jgi:hypothetical protein